MNSPSSCRQNGAMRLRGRRVAIGAKWLRVHPIRTTWVIIIPLFCSEEALRSQAVWLTKTLLILAGLVGPGILLPAAIRRIAYPLAGGVAALSGGLLSLAASSLNPSSTSSTAEIGPCVLALLVAGGAALTGQVLGQRDQHGVEQAMLTRLCELELAYTASKTLAPPSEGWEATPKPKRKTQPIGRVRHRWTGNVSAHRRRR